MRSSLELIERIENYLMGTMNPQDKVVFEAELITSDELKGMLENQRLIQQAINRKAIMADVQRFASTGHSGYNFWSANKWIIYLSVFIGTLAIIGVLFFNNNDKTISNSKASQILPGEANSNAIPVAQAPTGGSNNVFPPSSTGIISEMEVNNYPKAKIYSDGDKNVGGLRTWISPERQQFTVDPKESSTLECKDGTLIIIPSNTIVDANGTLVEEAVNIEVVEALTMDKMIAYNLSTLADGKALSSGGMVYIQPSLNGQNLSFSKERPIHIEVPTDNYQSNMMAWQGEANAKGDLNWTDPKPLEKFLVPVEFSTLDFVPETFRTQFRQQLPFENYKVSSPELEDSFYYSLTALSKGMQDTELPMGASMNALVEVSYISNLNNDGKEKSKTIIGSKTKSLGYPYTFRVDNLKKDLFTKTTLNIRSGETLIGSGTFDLSGHATLNLSTNEFDVVFIEIITEGCNPLVYSFSIDPDKVNLINLAYTMCSAQVIDMATCYIDPASIQAIRQSKFEGTLVATKEFEQRLKALHNIKYAQKLFEIYVENVGLDLFQLDKMVASKLEGEDKKVFEAFAAEGLTNVDLSKVNLEGLKEYYNDSRKEFKQIARKEQEKLEAKTMAQLTALDEKLNQAYSEFYGSSRAERGAIQSRLSSIFPLNNIRSVANTSSYKVSWFKTGWMNIDEYLHMLSKGELLFKIITDKDNQEDEKVYQCVNSMKTIIPLNKGENSYTAHYPSASNELSNKFRETYSIGLARGTDGSLMYSEAIFNPYSSEKVTLNWVKIPEEELIPRLRALSTNNEDLIISIENEREKITAATAFNEKSQAISTERNVILDKVKQKEIFIEGLMNSMDPCKRSEEMNPNSTIEEKAVGI